MLSSGRPRGGREELGDWWLGQCPQRVVGIIRCRLIFLRGGRAEDRTDSEYGSVLLEPVVTNLVLLDVNL